MGSAQHIPRFLWDRIYADFLMPCRLPSYSDLLQTALDHGYQAQSIISFWELLKRRRVNLSQKYLVLRHDIDNQDMGTVRGFWQIERNLGLKSTFYFRLSTLMPSLMQEMHRSGFEVGYHYEEVATVAKANGLFRREQVLAAMMQIRARFKTNLSQLRESTGLPMLTAASHGDFANRKLGITNCVILDDLMIRREMAIECEAYDSALRSRMSTLHSDVDYPGRWTWTSEDPREAIERGERVIHVLTHPRSWHADRTLNLTDEIERIRDGIRYFLKSRRFARDGGLKPIVDAAEFQTDPSLAFASNISLGTPEE